MGLIKSVRSKGINVKVGSASVLTAFRPRSARSIESLERYLRRHGLKCPREILYQRLAYLMATRRIEHTKNGDYILVTE